jgi:hypothetical protein
MDFIKDQPRKYAEVYNVLDSTGNYMSNVKNNKHCFHSYDAENNSYCVHVWRGAKDCMDCVTAGRNAEMQYNSLNCGVDAADIVACSSCWMSRSLAYCLHALSSSNCLGSIGRNQQYAILNKKYSKDEYESLRSNIIAELKESGVCGNFFEKQMSDFGYNESSAFIEFPLTKDEALAQGFKWEDTPRGTYGKETKKGEELPDSIGEVDFDAAKEVFVCINCAKNYKVISEEFAFYKKNAIPLPRLCPDCRHARRLEARGPNKLWHRQCMCTLPHHGHLATCINEFETSYAPDRPEIVYCEKCYQQEVI